jgi:hypothetical protein
MAHDRGGVRTPAFRRGTGRIPMKLADKRAANEAAHRARDRKSNDRDVVDARVVDACTAVADDRPPEVHS